MSSETPPENRPDREMLAAYALGKLSDAESQRVAEFIENDAQCQAMLVTLDAAEDTLVGNLRRPAADDSLQEDPIDAESQCDAAIARAKAVAGRLLDHAVEASAADSLIARELGEYQLLDRLGRRRHGYGLQGPAHQARPPGGLEGHRPPPHERLPDGRPLRARDDGHRPACVPTTSGSLPSSPHRWARPKMGSLGNLGHRRCHVPPLRRRVASSKNKI